MKSYNSTITSISLAIDDVTGETTNGVEIFILWLISFKKFHDCEMLSVVNLDFSILSWNLLYFSPYWSSDGPWVGLSKTWGHAENPGQTNCHYHFLLWVVNQEVSG